MSDSYAYKWAASQIDTIAPKGLTFQEASALLVVLSEHLAVTVNESRPAVDDHGTDYPRLPRLDGEPT
jgi:hypothetical protein